MTEVRHTETKKGVWGGGFCFCFFFLLIFCCTQIFLFYGKIHVYMHSSNSCDKAKNGCGGMGNVSNAIAHVTCMMFFKLFLNSKLNAL